MNARALCVMVLAGALLVPGVGSAGDWRTFESFEDFASISRTRCPAPLARLRKSETREIEGVKYRLEGTRLVRLGKDPDRVARVGIISAMLSSLSAEQITMAIATGSSDMLVMVPGIGKKVATRIILELKEKIGAGWIATPAAQIAQENTDVLAALTSLGYSAAEATKAVATLPADTPLDLE